MQQTKGSDFSTDGKANSGSVDKSMWQVIRRCSLVVGCVGFYCFGEVAWGQDPPADPAHRSGEDERPLVLPPKTRQRPKDQTVDEWVVQLSDNQFLRREIASRKLAETGPKAIPAIARILKTADLETVERAVWVMSEIALSHRPDDDGGAWIELTELATHASGVRASRAEAAVEEIREHRGDQARQALAAAGVFVGIDNFIVRATTQPRTMVQIDERWQGDVKALQWLRWLDGIEFARVKGVAGRRAVFAKLIEMPDLRTLAIVDATVDQATLEPLLKMSRIDSLEFRYVKLSPELGDMIAGMPIRVSLNLMGTGISAEKVSAMRAALPGLAIDHKQGGFLGVMCNDSPAACVIRGVTSGGAAEAAGLLPRDVIVRVGDSEVKRFSDLQQAVNQHLPGDEVEVTFVREEKVQSVTLRLRRLLEP